MTVSLLTATNSTGHIHLIIGSRPLAAARCAKSIEVGARPIVISNADQEDVHFRLREMIDKGQVDWIKRGFQDEDLDTLGREEIDGFVDAVFVTTGPRDNLGVHISKLCKRLRIPVNVIDAPQLSSFSLPATHTDGPLQIAVTTNGKGCKLATRIRREIASSLPTGIGSACERLGTMRERIQAEDHLALNELDEEESLDQSSTFNKLVTEADRDAAKCRRIRWLSQICEYWPLSRLAAVTDIDVDTVLNAYAANPDSLTPPLESNTLESRSSLQGRKGRIILAGSGPGHPDLLTVATLKAIKTSHLILADKLVPEGVLNLIPRRTPVHIARKFPGNAERAQEELLEWGLAGVKEGKTVLRLKQGDPYIYGRGGEEFEFFRKEGYGDRISVLPGITSSLSAPLFAMIPPTQRSVSDQVLICTGTGRKGAPSIPPEYVPTRTVVFLMALHRIEGLVADLTTHSLENNSLNGSETGEPHDSSPDEGKKVSHDRRLWPLSTPCAVIERASCPDQRVIRTTLEYVAGAIEEEGSRPPGLLVLGNCCEVLVKPDGKGGRKWVTEEGFKGLDGWGDMPDGVLDWASGVNGLGDVDGLGKPNALLTNGLREVSVQ